MTIQAVSALALAASLAVAGCSDPHAKSTSQPEKDPGVYYRMKVGLTYKGQPVDIDFVAGCNVHLGRDLSGGSIEEINGMTDLFRGVRMPEGHAVIINTYPWFEGPTFNPCLGDTTDHSSNDIKKADTRVAKDWLPFIEWVENADEPAHAIGYMTQDAYENKNARFGFRYARIEHATRQQFEAFRKTGPANLLPPHQTNWMHGRPDPIYYNASEVPEKVRKYPPSGWWHTSGLACTGIIRWRPTDAQRALLRASWPKDRPEYWTIADSRARFRLASEVSKPHDSIPTGGHHVTHFVVPYTAELRSAQLKFYPVASNWALSNLSRQTSATISERAQIGDGIANLGFVACDIIDLPIIEAVTGRPSQPGYDLTIDGTSISGLPAQRFGRSESSPLFERDGYLISVAGGP